MKNTAIYDMITSNASINALISNRCYPRVAEKKQPTFPLVTYRQNNTLPNHAKNSVSGVDFVFVDLFIYSTTQLEADTISETIRTELDGYSGTHDGVNIGYVYFYDADSDGYLDDLKTYINRVELKLEIKR